MLQWTYCRRLEVDSVTSTMKVTKITNCAIAAQSTSHSLIHKCEAKFAKNKFFIYRIFKYGVRVSRVNVNCHSQVLKDECRRSDDVRSEEDDVKYTQFTAWVWTQW